MKAVIHILVMFLLIIFQLLKVDILRKTTKEWKPTYAYASEPVFVSRPGGEAEDDGW